MLLCISSGHDAQKARPRSFCTSPLSMAATQSNVTARTLCNTPDKGHLVYTFRTPAMSSRPTRSDSLHFIRPQIPALFFLHYKQRRPYLQPKAASKALPHQHHSEKPYIFRKIARWQTPRQPIRSLPQRQTQGIQ